MKRHRNPEGAVEGKILACLLAQGQASGLTLAQKAQIPVGSVYGRLYRMEERSLIERIPEQDGNSKFWKLTAKGVALAGLNEKYLRERDELEAYYDRQIMIERSSLFGVRPEGTAATRSEL